MKKLSLWIVGAFVFGCLAAPPVVAAGCGDGVLEDGEQCDDGNLVDGDCCSSSCSFESTTTVCADDGIACTYDHCDGAGTCIHGEFPSCSVAKAGKLSVVDASDDAKDAFALKLQKAPATDASAFGDPTTSDGARYQACVFGPDGLVMAAEVAPGNDCGGKPCWVATKKGFKFKDKAGTNDGINTMQLNGSPKPKTSLSVKGKGSNVPVPALPAPEPLLAQIVDAQSGQCFESYFLSSKKLKQKNGKLTATAADPKGGSFGLGKIVRSVPTTASVVARDEAEHTPRTGPDPSEVYVQSISYGGTGCPAGTVSTSFSADRSSFTLIFDSFIATTGPGVPAGESRKNCQLNVNLRVPQGWSYTVASVDYRGSMQLPAGATASQKATYYFAGDTEQVSATTEFEGPIARDYLVRDEVPADTVVWSSCSAVRPLNVNVQVSLASAKAAQITNDSGDGKLAHVLGFQWKPCP